MQIMDRLVTDYNGFVLDTASLKLHSLEACRIVFPYSGPLPEGLAGSVGVCVTMDIWLISGAQCVLKGIDAHGQEFALSLSADPSELMDLFDRYWKGAASGDGLSNYGRGILFARYRDWRSVTVGPFLLVDMIRRLPEDKQRRIHTVLSSRFMTKKN